MDMVPQILKSGYTVSITIQKMGHDTKIYLTNSANQTVSTSGRASRNPGRQHD